jgi:hypothetical protein
MEPKRQRLVGHGTDRPEHPFLIVARGLWSACDEDDPNPVVVDVGLEEADVTLISRALDGLHHLVERIGRRSGSLPEQHVGAGEAKECDRRLSMLGLDRVLTDVIANGHGNALRERKTGHVGQLRQAGRRHGDV